MKVVVALGGNALLRRGEPVDAQTQVHNAATAAGAIAQLIEAGHTVVVTHGNGPQVGHLALQAESYAETAPYPLDVLGAETEGQIGYLLEQELANALPEHPIVVLLTRVEVAPDDPAFSSPSKPIGPTYTAEQARALEQSRGFVMARDGQAWRRVVPSPEPRRIVELPSIRLLVDAGHLVVCGGGGGIPITIAPNGQSTGVEAVVDKDRSSAILALDLEADLLLLLTDVAALYLDWPDRSKPVRDTTVHALRQLDLESGSMAPKVDAACRFVERGGGRAAIGVLEDALELTAGSCGTQIRSPRASGRLR